MAIHVARTGLFSVGSDGSILTGTYTIKEKITSTSDVRVIPNDNIPNSTNHPTVEAYLILEEAGGFNLAHMDQTFIITHT